MLKTMKVTLRNIGSINDATIDLEKDLTVFIGPNNTGKTYASYCLYGLAKNIVKLPNSQSNLNIDISELIETGEQNINLNEVFNYEFTLGILKEYQEGFKEKLKTIFGTEQSLFEQSEITLVAESKEDILNTFLKLEYNVLELSDAGSITYNKVKDSLTVKLSINRKIENDTTDNARIINSEKVLNRVRQTLLQYSIRPYHSMYGPIFLPAERIGISVFSKDLFSNRFTKTNEILTLDIPNKDRIVELMSKEVGVYSLVIQDFLRLYERHTRNNKNSLSDLPIKKLADELEEKLLRGRVSIDNSGDVFFTSDSNKSISIQATGSIVKSLTSLVFSLRYSLHKGQLFIIDEPEINLHPDNQRIVARILAKLCNLGVKVVVSTHSDYFIRELNNLIMLNKEHKDKSSLLTKYGYSDEEVLDFNKVGAYIFKDKKAKELEVTETGMNAGTIDEEINSLNNTANDIYWTLFED